MTIAIHYVDPKTKVPLRKNDTVYYSETGSVYPIVQSFGLQWN